MNAPIALTIAGSDSGGGAGIQADLKTFAAHKVFGTTAITALTAQNTLGVQGIFDVPPEFVKAQIRSVFDDLRPHAVKIGMLSNTQVIEAVAQCLIIFKAQNIVLDPVMIATSGDKLLHDDAIASLKQKLFPLAMVITPNLHEAAALLDAPVAQNEQEMTCQAYGLMGQGVKAVLIKGGHFFQESYGEGADCIDILVSAHGISRFSSPRINTKNTHGTGCTLSSAIAASLAHGHNLVDAVGQAKAYVTAAILGSVDYKLGQGHGSTHHFHQWW